MRVNRFDKSSHASDWDNFINSGKNQTFLFNRAFMDYHSHRFEDYSLMLYDDNNVLMAALPANISKDNGQILISHEGLTYGGLVLKPDVKIQTVISVVYYLLKYLNEHQIEEWKLKQIPAFYNKVSTSEVEYVLFLLGAELYRRDVAFVIDQQHKIPASGNIRREGNKAERSGATVSEDSNMKAFWQEVLVPNLQQRFGIMPVHSLEEISLLKSNFPEQIKQFNVYIEDTIVAGTTLFICDEVVHCQYISANEAGRKSGALNFLFRKLIDEVFINYRYFDFGIVNENNGKEINTGMLFWKESFGGRAMQHDFYAVATASFKKLEKYLA